MMMIWWTCFTYYNWLLYSYVSFNSKKLLLDKFQKVAIWVYGVVHKSKSHKHISISSLHCSLLTMSFIQTLNLLTVYWSHLHIPSYLFWNACTDTLKERSNQLRLLKNETFYLLMHLLSVYLLCMGSHLSKNHPLKPRPLHCNATHLNEKLWQKSRIIC